MKKILFSLLVFSFVYCSAQEKTYTSDGERFMEKRGGLGSLVIIPFKDKMYMSDADAPIGKETGLKPGEIMTKFRYSLVESLEKEMLKDWSIVVINEESKLEEGFGLEYIYSSVGYRYVPVPEHVMMSNDTTIKKKDLRKKKPKKGQESGIYQGEIVTYSDKQEKYMTLIIENDTLLKFMDGSLQSDYYLFLNEFDIRHHISDPDKISSGGLNYRLKVHFTCVDDAGVHLVSGAATSDVSAATKNIYQIIQQAIPELTQKLSKMIRKYRIEGTD